RLPFARSDHHISKERPAFKQTRGVYALCFAPVEADGIGKLTQQFVVAQQRFVRGASKMAVKGLPVGRCAQERVEAFDDRYVCPTRLLKRLQRDKPIRIDETQEVEEVLGVRLQWCCR